MDVMNVSYMMYVSRHVTEGPNAHRPHRADQARAAALCTSIHSNDCL
jgi:hypothetical protein